MGWHPWVRVPVNRDFRDIRLVKSRILPILDIPYSPEAYRRIQLGGLGPEAYRGYLEGFFRESGARVAYGGYMENRSLYAEYAHFGTTGQAARTLHLGLDLWAPEGTSVRAPKAGRVHSWGNHKSVGDYGPVILMEHETAGGPIHTLYGHLSPDDLRGLRPGRRVRAGEIIGHLGGESDNGGYWPHLHFQVIHDLQGYSGDYPGVTDAGNRAFFERNCPDPALFLGLP